MQVKYMYHSGFVVVVEHLVLVFDYFRGALPEVQDGMEMVVFVSHQHYDHYQKKILEWQEEYPNVQYVLAEEVKMMRGDFSKGRIRFVKGRENFSIPLQKKGTSLQVETLLSTDEGVGYYLTYQGEKRSISIYHAGDLNWWCWKKESPSFLEEMAANYKKFVEPLRNRVIDIAFVPCDPRLEEGRDCGVDYLLSLVQVRYLFLMHLWKQYHICDEYAKKVKKVYPQMEVMQIKEKNQEFEIPL